MRQSTQTLLSEAENDPANPEKWYQAGKYAIDRYIVGIGERCISEAARLSPEDPRILDLLGKALNRKRHLEKAVTVYEKALEIDPSNPSLWTGLGVVRSHQGKKEISNECLRKALSIDPGFSWAVSCYSTLFEDPSEVRQGLVTTQKAVDVNPNNALNWACHYELLNKIGDTGQAESALGKAISTLRESEPDDQRRASIRVLGSSRGNEAMQMFEEIVAEDPENINAMIALVGAFLSKDIHRANEILEKAAKLDPSNPLVRTTRATILMHTGDIAAAMQLMKESQEQSPEDPLLMAVEAEILPMFTTGVDEEDSSEQRKRGLNASRRMVERYPKRVHSRIMLAHNLLADFQREAAVDVIEEVKLMENFSPENYIRFIPLLLQINDNEGALEYARKGKENADNPIVGTYILAILLSGMRKYTELAESILELAQLGDSDQWYSIVGRIYKMKGENEQSKEMITKAVKAGVLDSKIILASLVKNDDAQESEKILTEILNSVEEDDTLAIKARALFGLGRNEEAVQVLEDTVSRSPNDRISWYLLILSAKQSGRGSISELINRLIKANAKDLTAFIPTDKPQILGEFQLAEEMKNSVENGSMAEDLQHRFLNELLMTLSKTIPKYGK